MSMWKRYVSMQNTPTKSTWKATFLKRFISKGNQLKICMTTLNWQQHHIARAILGCVVTACCQRAIHCSIPFFLPTASMKEDDRIK